MLLTLTGPEDRKLSMSDTAYAMLKALELTSGRKDVEILDAAIQAQRVVLVPAAKKAGVK